MYIYTYIFTCAHMDIYIYKMQARATDPSSVHNEGRKADNFIAWAPRAVGSSGRRMASETLYPDHKRMQTHGPSRAQQAIILLR